MDKGEKPTTPELLIGTQPSREVLIISEECGSLATAILPNVLLPQISSAMIPYERVVVREPLEPKHDEPMEVEPFTAKDTLLIEERKGEAQLNSMTTEAMKFRKESSTDNQVIVDTPSTTGFTSG